jgi:hypothetical protein
VQKSFNGCGLLIQEWQAHGGVVNTSSTPSVQHSYGAINQGIPHNTNQSRLSSIIYPNGRTGRLEKPMKDGDWQGIDPSTMKPGSQPETHVPLPPGTPPVGGPITTPGLGS